MIGRLNFKNERKIHMKLKKILISLILASAMLFNTACSENASTPDVSDSADTSTSAPAEETTEKTEEQTPEKTEENTTTTTGKEPDTEENTTTEAAQTESETDAAAESTTPEAVTTAETTAAATTAATTTAAATTAAETTTAATEAVSTSSDKKTSKSEVRQLPADVENIVNAMGAGWNLGNQLEASLSGTPSETAWGNPVITEALIKTVKAQGFKTVRIPVSYLLKIGDGPDYKIEEAWLDRVQEVVDYVINNGLYAVMNIHGDGYYTIDKGWLLCAEDDDKQTVIKEKYKAVWTQIAERFKDYGDHLIFESMNEVFDDTYGSPNPKYYENINDYNQIFVNAVRGTGSNNTSRWLLVPGWNTDINNTVSDLFRLPTDSTSGKLMVSVHYYDPYSYALQTDSKVYKWGNDATKGMKPSWGHEDYVEEQMKKLYDKFTSKGVPVIIGEFGAIDKTWSNAASREYRRYFFEYVANAAVNNGCIPVYWDNGYDGNNGFALFNRSSATVLYQDLIDAIVRGAVRNSYDIEVPPAV